MPKPLIRGCKTAGQRVGQQIQTVFFSSLLDEVSAAARDAIAMMLDVDPADVGAIDVHVQEQGEAGSLA